MFHEIRSRVKILYQYKGACKLSCFARKIEAYSMFQF